MGPLARFTAAPLDEGIQDRGGYHHPPIL